MALFEGATLPNITSLELPLSHLPSCKHIKRFSGTKTTKLDSNNFGDLLKS